MAISSFSKMFSLIHNPVTFTYISILLLTQYTSRVHKSANVGQSEGNNKEFLHCTKYSGMNGNTHYKATVLLFYGYPTQCRHDDLITVTAELNLITLGLSLDHEC